ncbi:hypothetical protein OUZ56_007410 [Daphnia magna]|uniref:Uncharacterized protein n=1 Tax=Daphnia magna TaxID=35525 RepID=A0ABR0A9W3_9CRUS|nr:hypothetical protein OUZ56_007410 [Daphnia magna]
MGMRQTDAGFSIGFNARIQFFFTALLAPPPLRMFHHISIHLISRLSGCLRLVCCLCALSRAFSGERGCSRVIL